MNFKHFVNGRATISATRYIVSYLFLITFIVTVAATSAFYFSERDMRLSDLEQRTESIVSRLAADLSRPLWDFNNDRIRAIVESSMQTVELFAVEIRDSEAGILKVFVRNKEQEIVEYQYIPDETAGLLHKEQLIALPSGKNAKVAVYVTAHYVFEDLRKSMIRVFLSVLLLFLIQSTCVYYCLKKALFRPLSHIASGAGNIRTSDFTIIEKNSSFFVKEIDDLSSSLNEMIEALRASEKQFRNIFENAVEGFFQADLKGKLLTVNPSFARFFGFDSSGALLSSNMNSGEFAYANANKRSELLAHLREYGEMLGYEVEMQRSDGTLFWASVSAKILHNEEGLPEVIEGTLWDISQRKRVEFELKEAYDGMERLVKERTSDLNDAVHSLRKEVATRKGAEIELEEALEKANAATEAKSHFLANMSHEIRTPMNAIIGMHHLLKMTDLTASQADYLNKANTAARSLLEIINDILDLSKVEAGMMLIEDTEVVLPDLIDQLLSIHTLKAEEKGLSFQLDIENDVPFFFKGDPTRVLQILVNLCSNAIKFTKRGGVLVRIRLIERRGEEILLRFEVKDDGIGIQSDRLEDIFSPFTQADSSTTREYGGTGLGLSLCRQLVEMMGGEIGVESRADEGSTFWFELPFREMRVSDVDSSHHELLKGLNILVVDDSPVACTTICSMLESSGLSCVSANSASEAFALLKSPPNVDGFDLAIIDWKMPDINGFDLIDSINTASSLIKKPKLFIMSVHGCELLFQEAGRRNVHGILLKPINKYQLLEQIISIFTTPSINEVSRKAEQISFDNHEILLVEDNEINRQVAREVLRERGVLVHEATNGKEAVDFLSTHSVNLVLMDVQMPVMGGYEASRLIREQRGAEKLPIIAMTAHAGKDDVQRCYEAGMDDHIAKPFDPEELFKIICKWVQGNSTGCHEQDIQNHAEALFPKIPGIDVEAGLNRARGNRDLYHNLLTLLKDKYSNAAIQIRQYLDESDLQSAKRMAHSIKGSAGTMGAMALYDAAGVLEDSIRDRGGDIEEVLESFEEQLSKVMDGIKTVSLSDNGPEPLAKKQGETLKVLKDVRSSLLSGNPVKSQKGLKDIQRLASFETSRELVQISQLIEGYNYREAIAFIDRIESNSSASIGKYEQ